MQDESQCVRSLDPSLKEQELQNQASGSNGLPIQEQNPAEAAVAQLLSGLSKPAVGSSVGSEEKHSSYVVGSNASEPLCNGDDFSCRL